MVTPIDHTFEDQATWGQLSGKAGEFLLKNFSDRESASPDDVWIVDQTLFRQMYEVVSGSQSAVVPLLRSPRRSSALGDATTPPHCMSQSRQAVARPVMIHGLSRATPPQ